MDVHRITRLSPLSYPSNDTDLSISVNSVRTPQAADPIYLAINRRLDALFAAHRKAEPHGSNSPCTAADTANEHNKELDAIRDDRARRLYAAGYTVQDMDTVERNANIADKLFATLKAGMGGTPFAAVTMATNIWPSSLSVFAPRDTPEAEAALQNALASWYAGAADASANAMISGLKPGLYQRPADDKLHNPFQASRAEKSQAYDRGLFGTAMNECNKWMVGFAIRNAALYPLRVALESQGQQKLAATLEHYMRPVTAVIVGIAIEHYDMIRDSKRHMLSTAILYGHRDTVQKEQEPKSLADEQEWLDQFEVLNRLDANALLEMVPKRLGEATAEAIKSIVTVNALKAVLTPASILGTTGLALGFAVTGAATTATREAAKNYQLNNGEIAAAAEAVKNILGALAFGLWAIGASLGESASRKAVEATDTHVANNVERVLNNMGRGCLAAVNYTESTAGSLATVSRNHVTRLGRSTANAFSSGAQNSRDLYNRPQRGFTPLGTTTIASSPSTLPGRAAARGLAPPPANATTSAEAPTITTAPSLPSTKDAGDIV